MTIESIVEVDEKLVYKINNYGEVEAINLEDGRQVWKYYARPEKTLPVSLTASVFAALNKDTLYIGYSYFVNAINKQDGKLKWSGTVGDIINSLVLSKKILCVKNGLADKIVGFDLETGKKRWLK